MNGLSRQAFRNWWEKEAKLPFASLYIAYQAWAAALEWYGRQRRLLDELVGSNDADQSDVQEL